MAMDRSTYEFLGDQINASPFNTDGSLAPTYQYASAAATAFASSAADLSNEVTLLNGKDFPCGTSLLDAELTALCWVRESGAWAMLYVQTHNGDFVFA